MARRSARRSRVRKFQTWLAGSPDETFGLALEYAPDHMRIVQEGFDKEDLLGKASQLPTATLL